MPAADDAALVVLPAKPRDAIVFWFVRSSWVLAYCTWCHAVRIAPWPGLSSRFGYRSRVASSAALNTSAKSASYTDFLAAASSALVPPQAATPAHAQPHTRRKMIRCREVMGGRTRNSTPQRPSAREVFR